MSHPCDGHPCDHCYLCDVVGICCMTVSHGATSPVTVPDRRLHDAIVEAAHSVPGLVQLIHEAPAEPSIAQLVRDEPARHHVGELVKAEPIVPNVAGMVGDEAIKVIPAGPRSALPAGPPQLVDSTPKSSEEVLHVPIARHHS